MDKPDELTRQQLQLIYDNTSDLVFLIDVSDADGYRVASVNPAFLERTGLKLDRFVGRPVEQVLSGGERDYVLAHYDHAVASGRPYRYETRTTLRGATIYLDTTLVPVFNSDGGCSHLIGVSREITDLKQEQHALRREKQRAENYLDIAEALIVALDRDANITLLNRKGYHVLGYPEGTLTGCNWCELCIAPDKRQAYLEGLQRWIETGNLARNVNYVTTASGERRLISWANAPILDDDGVIVGVLSSGEDITDRRRAERAMIASQRVLAADEVVAAVAHDFNNSLQGILGNIEIAMADPDPGKQRDRLQTAAKLADDAARRLRVLHSRAAVDPADDHEPLDVDELIDDVMAQTQPLWKDEAQRRGRDVAVQRQRSGPLKPVTGNRSELRTVLYNVVKNAIEAIDQDGAIGIETRCDDDVVIVTVSDSGIGMDEETATRIFQPFFSTKGVEAGRGLGMSASHNIVRGHGGDLRVTFSAPGQGTSIQVRLPTAGRARRTSGDTDGRASASRHHVLWVDDDPQVRALAGSYLAALQHTGDVASSADEALRMLARNHYTVVITDVGMPGMNGLELAERIQAQTGGRLPVVALTGWGDTINEGDLPPSGIDLVIAKPIRLQKVKETLDALPLPPGSDDLNTRT